LHVHDAHFIRLACGMPQRVFTSGRMRGAVAEYFTTQFLYGDDGPVVTVSGEALGQERAAAFIGRLLRRVGGSH
jgi:hypothetical protein